MTWTDTYENEYQRNRRLFAQRKQAARMKKLFPNGKKKVKPVIPVYDQYLREH